MPRKMKIIESLGLASEEENMVLYLRTGSQNPTGKSLSVLSPSSPASRKLSQGNSPKEKTSTLTLPSLSGLWVQTRVH